MIIYATEAIDSLNDIPDGWDIRDWEPVLNLGEIYEPFCRYDFQKTSKKTGGTHGGDWITDRIMELHDGAYARRMENPDQIKMIVERLKKRMHGSCTNGLVAQVFQQKDLERATVPRPNNSKNISCITQFHFHPKKEQLHLHQSLRSQYLDLKGYGNLIGAATMLAKVCHETGYEPGNVYEHIGNVTTYRRRHIRAINNL